MVTQASSFGVPMVIGLLLLLSIGVAFVITLVHARHDIRNEADIREMTAKIPVNSSASGIKTSFGDWAPAPAFFFHLQRPLIGASRFMPGVVFGVALGFLFAVALNSALRAPTSYKIAPLTAPESVAEAVFADYIARLNALRSELLAIKEDPDKLTARLAEIERAVMAERAWRKTPRRPEEAFARQICIASGDQPRCYTLRRDGE